MSKEDRNVPVNAQSERDLDLVPGQTVVLARADLKSSENYPDPQDRAFAEFFHAIAQDPNIKGVAISMINGGGVYTDWFVSEISDSEKARRSLEVTGASYKLLEEATGDRTGYASFIQLGGRSFDEAEAQYKADWSIVDEDNPFSSGTPHGQDLELLGIIRIE